MTGKPPPDHDGTELPSIDAARSHAARCAGELLQQNSDVFWSGDELGMDVKEGTGPILFCLLFCAIDSAAAPRKGLPA